MSPRIVKVFTDGTRLEFDEGKFDSWCVYMVNPDGSRRPPLDTEYFKTLLDLGYKHGKEKVYKDFVRVYEATDHNVSGNALQIIEDIAVAYGQDSLLVAKTLTTIYMGMIAEQNKEGTKLGKRIKRLGVHCLLLEGISIEDAANFMRNKKWQDIEKLCTKRGF
jgi:hypothetical protein